MEKEEMKVSVSIFTTDLTKFGYVKVNRDFSNKESQNRIKKISQSMMTDGLFNSPIIVTKTLRVIDGQHRLEAARIVGLGIWYTIDEKVEDTEEGIFEAAKKYNRYHKDWSKNDYLYGMTKRGDKDYESLTSFRNEFPMFSLTECMMFLQNSGKRNISKEGFIEGKFRVKNLLTAYQWGERIMEIKPFFPQGYNRSNFVRTMLIIFETQPNFDFNDFMNKVRRRPTSLKLCGDKRSYSELIEQIYNYGRRNEDRLRLRFL